MEEGKRGIDRSKIFNPLNNNDFTIYTVIALFITSIISFSSFRNSNYMVDNNTGFSMECFAEYENYLENYSDPSHLR